MIKILNSKVDFHVNFSIMKLSQPDQPSSSQFEVTECPREALNTGINTYKQSIIPV